MGAYVEIAPGVFRARDALTRPASTAPRSTPPVAARPAQSPSLPARHTPPPPVAVRELETLVDNLATPLLRSAITGSREQVAVAASLVRSHVETHGQRAAEELHSTAAQVSDRQLVVNLSRAASVLAHGSADAIARVHVDHVRGGRRRRR